MLNGMLIKLFLVHVVRVTLSRSATQVQLPLIICGLAICRLEKVQFYVFPMLLIPGFGIRGLVFSMNVTPVNNEGRLYMGSEWIN